ncbi:sugar lactone lactonase YvrE [Kribbella amoyensis]|uniref:Sugar lactone lactonase YvrE n=1 Tax=Kribbella amoyensis TaxID=996641 RepID=A0A561BSF7_9ACTN|nr:superoxide dismutase [Kribbella amoyensis]TWD81801.1 sugar lactone lactonase YvrE [Kribbella amoyensis]
MSRQPVRQPGPTLAARHLGRTLAVSVGLSALLLTSLTTASATAGPETVTGTRAAAGTPVKHSADDGLCAPRQFGRNAATGTSGRAPAFPQQFALPAGFQPEGIAIAGTKGYFGSRVDGDIWVADLRTGNGRILSEGPGTASLGMKVDGQGRLFVAGAAGGNGRVIDTRTGKVLASYTFTTATPTFVNDVILTKDAAWFTDSRQPVLYKVPLGRHGKLPAQSAVTSVPLSGDYVHDPVNNNGNGISLTPDGRALIIVQSATGTLFRVDPGTGATKATDLGGAVMTNGDGLLLSNDTLYVVQNRLNKIAVLDLDRRGTSGRLVREITSPHFDVPTTAAFFGQRIYLPNARFTTPPTPETEYSVTAVGR